MQTRATGGLRPRGRIALLAAALLLLLGAVWPQLADAQPREGRNRTEGTVLRIDGNELLVDLGAVDDLQTGDAVRLYRRVVVEHPITRRPIEDRFPIGEEQIAQVAERMSIILLDQPFSHAPAVGDSVVLQRAERPAEPPPEAEASCPACEPPACPLPVPCPTDVEGAWVLDSFLQTLGRPLEERIGIWERFLVQHAESPHAGTLAADLGMLRGLRATEQQRTQRTANAPIRVGHEPPEEAYRGEPLEIVMAVDPRDELRLVQLHLRRSGDDAFITFDAESDGDTYVRVRVPEEFLQGSGFEYFIAAIDARGAERRLGGTPEDPIQVPVAERGETPPVRVDRSLFATRFEYVDFYVLDAGRDYYLRFETDFTYRLGAWLYSLRMGFGIFDGAGGPVDRIDRDPSEPEFLAPQPISYRYGFAELEFRLHEIVYLAARLSFGSAAAYRLQDGRSEAPEALVGGEGRLRIGRPDGTNLELGGGYVEDLGYEARVAVNLDLVDDWPMRGEVIVTDMPVDEELGVRLVANVGWRPLTWLEVDLLIGYGIRTIHHAGLSAGLGTVFHW